MRNRFDNALTIQQGASNPSGVARSLVEAIDEARAENPSTSSVCEDPAVRLICHQLSSLLGIWAIDNTPDEYGKLTRLCQEKAVEMA